MNADSPYEANSSPGQTPRKTSRRAAESARKPPAQGVNQEPTKEKPKKPTPAKPSKQNPQKQADGVRKPPPPPGIDEKRRLAIAKAKALRAKQKPETLISKAGAEPASGVESSPFVRVEKAGPEKGDESQRGESDSGVAQKPSQAIPKRSRRTRAPSETTISRTYYDRVRQKLAWRGLGQTAVFAFIGLCFALGLIWMWRAHSIQGTIIRLNIDAWNHLAAAHELLDPETIDSGGQRQQRLSQAQDLRNKARENFDRAVELYRDRIRPEYEWLWRSNPKLFPTMVNVAHGYQRLREIEPALETFRILASRISDGEGSWLWISLPEAIDSFIEPDSNFDWNPDERERLYRALLQQNPKDWRYAEFDVVRKTERVSLAIKPMGERFAEADLAMYGTLRPMQSESDASVVVDAEIVYKIDDDPGVFRLILAPNLGESARQRTYWYSHSEAHCLFFATFDEEENAILAGVEGILLSEPHTVPDFNRAVEQFEIDSEPTPAWMDGDGERNETAETHRETDANPGE